MRRWQMLLRVVSKAIWFRPAKLSASLGALTVGATLSSAFLSLYFVLPSKLSGEFKSLGPNLIIASRQSDQTFDENLYGRLNQREPQLTAVPWLYAVGKAAQSDVVLGGTDLARLARINPGWQVFRDLKRASSQSLETMFSASEQDDGRWLFAGQQTAEHFGWAVGQTVEIEYGDRKMTLPLRGVISTGGSEDSQIILPLALLQSLAGQPARLSLIQVRVTGPAEQVETRRKEIAALLPDLDVRPLLQVVESETRVVMKVRALMYGLTAVVLGIVILSLMTTFSGLVLDRQKDIGVMKTLGGSDAMIALLFVAETAVSALIAALLGHAIGFGLADWAAHGIFRSALPWRWDVLASVVGVTMLIALIATTVPIRLVRKLEPALILKGN